MKCSKAIIPVAGYGTRRLPVSKAVEKCMLPLGNRPVVDYIVQDCVNAGITDIYFVVSGSALQLRSYYSRDMQLESYLINKGREDIVDQIQPPQGVTFHYIEQDLTDGRYGTTVPVWLARDYIEPDEMVAIIMGDAVSVTPHGKNDLEEMILSGKPTILGVLADPNEDLSSKGGVLSLKDDGSFRAIVEHADPTLEPSRLKNCGMYLLPGEIAKLAEQQIESKAAAYNGEYFLIDIINDLADRHEMHVQELKGKYLDAGSLDSWVYANNWLLENA